MESLESDQELVIQADYILAIVPPRNALATAQRIADACKSSDTSTKRRKVEGLEGLQARRKPFYIDLNAIPARLSREISDLLSNSSVATSSSPVTSEFCHFLDGGIIGLPPSQDPSSGSWKKPSLVISGSPQLPPTFTKLSEVLNMKLISDKIGAASTLKLMFASLTKGLTALSILSFSTAQQESLLPELLEHLQEFSPQAAAMAVQGVSAMPSKAYRWIDEMQGIGEAMDTEGKWKKVGSSVFDGIAEVYRTIAEETPLGEKKMDGHKRERSAEDVAQIVAESLEKLSKRKTK